MVLTQSAREIWASKLQPHCERARSFIEQQHKADLNTRTEKMWKRYILQCFPKEPYKGGVILADSSRTFLPNASQAGARTKDMRELLKWSESADLLATVVRFGTAGLVPKPVFMALAECNKMPATRGAVYLSRLNDVVQRYAAVLCGETVDRDKENETIEREVLLKAAGAALATRPPESPERSETPRTAASVITPLLQQKGWSRFELAQHACVDHHTVNGYLNGKRQPTATTRKKIADALSIAAAELP